jgi:hypothetical protein
LNEATCTPTVTGSTYTCTCAAAYSGTNCQIFNACYNNPCLNGATCQTSGSSYICICTQFYSGVNCQLSTTTTTSPTTTTTTNTTTTTTTTRTTTSSTSTTTTTITTVTTTTTASACNNQCYNGATCQLDSEGSPVCTCLPDYTGFFCDQCKIFNFQKLS